MLEVETKVVPEIRYAVIFSSYFLIYVNTTEIFYKSYFYDVQFQSIVFLFLGFELLIQYFPYTYVVFTTPSRLPKSLKVMSKKPIRKWLLLMQRLLMMRTFVSINCIVSVAQHQYIVQYSIINKCFQKIKITPPPSF